MLVPCIAVIDEDSNDDNNADWKKFRDYYPHRPFCLIIPFEPAYCCVGLPDDAENDPYFQVHQVVRDRGNLPADDWFTLCGLDKIDSSNIQHIGLFVDVSGSMKKSTVKNSYNKFLEDVKTAGLSICEVYDEQEDWITPFNKNILPSNKECGTPKPVQKKACLCRLCT